MFRPEQDRFLVGSLHFDAMGFHAGIILESIMDDPAIEGVERLQLHHITPTPDLFSGLLGFLHQRLPGQDRPFPLSPESVWFERWSASFAQSNRASSPPKSCTR